LVAAMKYPALCLCIFFVAITTVCGCGDSRFAPVSGTVTLDGQLMADVHVTFQPINLPGDRDFCPTSHGTTDSSGYFTLKSSAGAGALVGKHKVILHIKHFDTAPDPTSPREERPTFQYILPPAARDGSLKFTVPEGGTDQANFAFESRADAELSNQ